MMNYEELNKKYPMLDRDVMTKEQEREFVNDIFEAYENEGFSKVFWSLDSEYKKYTNKPFKVLCRLDEKSCDLECLPMWKIQFLDGMQIHAYPDEIIPSEMIGNGCKLEIK